MILSLRKIIHRVTSPLTLAILVNALAVAPTVPYLFLPRGSIVLYDDRILTFWVLPIAALAFFGIIPYSVWHIERQSLRGAQLIWPILSISLCLLPIYAAKYSLRLAGQMRDLRTPCYPCDGGGDTMKWTEVR